MLDPRSTTPERAAYAALFYRPDQTGPRSTRHGIDRRASAACACIQTKRKKQVKQYKHAELQAKLHADACRMCGDGPPCGAKHRIPNRRRTHKLELLHIAVPSLRKAATSMAACTAAKSPLAKRRCQHLVVSTPCCLLHIHDVQRRARLQCRMLKTGRGAALHAGTKPVANPVFDTEVASLSNRSLSDRLRFGRLLPERPSRPEKTLHHDQ